MINLSKGGRINLSKESNNGLSKLFFGSNWGAIRRRGLFGIGGSIEKIDLDSTVLLYDANKNCIGEVAYYNLNAPGIHHSGDDRSGDTNGNDGLDNETIEVRLNELDPRVEYIAFTLNNFTHQTFGEIPYMGLRIYTGDRVQRNTNTPVNVLASLILKMVRRVLRFLISRLLFLVLPIRKMVNGALRQLVNSEVGLQLTL